MKQPKSDKEIFLDNVSHIGYFCTDLSRTVLEWNKTCEDLFGYKKEEVIGKKIEELIIPDYMKEHFIKDFEQKSAVYGDEIEYKNAKNQTILLYSNTLFTGEHYYALLVDTRQFKVTKQLENAIEQSKKELKDRVNMIMISLDRNGYINDFNHFAEKLTGYKKEEVIGRNFVELFLPESYKEKTLAQIQKSFATKQILMPNDFPLMRRNGEKIVVHWERSLIASSDDKKGSLLLLGEHKNSSDTIHDRLEYLANYDSLTDLPNKNLLYDRLHNAINKAARQKQNMITVFINLDNFKAINHTLGYAIGDKILKETATRLQSELRDYDTVARFSGDEFVILFENINDELAAGIVAQRISKLFETPFQIEENEVTINANMGISFFPSDGNDPKTLIKNANMAMLRAKEDANSNYHFFKAQIHEEITRRIQMESHMRKAIKNREFFVEYQPLVDAQSAKIIGAEALVRWNHPELKVIPPLDFIPVAEDTGMILEIGELVLESAITQMQEWHKEGYTDLKISINISGIQLLQSNLENTIDTILSKTGFDPSKLQLELTESTLMQNIERASEVLQNFKKQGIQISIDDFGTGYSSLNYLKRLPIDSLKIDQSFIRNIDTDQSDKIIVNTIIAMGHSLGLEVIAEGIEEPSQKRYLQEHQCDILQGFLFGKSLNYETFGALLQEGISSIKGDDKSSDTTYEIEQKLRKYSEPLKISF
jgi:diguanylate cyclase (GGDEF)-like protein/PAS domain S-box-containing protein